jgi:hypothetical protein
VKDRDCKIMRIGCSAARKRCSLSERYTCHHYDLHHFIITTSLHGPNHHHPASYLLQCTPGKRSRVLCFAAVSTAVPAFFSLCVEIFLYLKRGSLSCSSQVGQAAFC